MFRHQRLKVLPLGVQPALSPAREASWAGTNTPASHGARD